MKNKLIVLLSVTALLLSLIPITAAQRTVFFNDTFNDGVNVYGNALAGAGVDGALINEVGIVPNPDGGGNVLGIRYRNLAGDSQPVLTRPLPSGNITLDLAPDEKMVYTFEIYRVMAPTFAQAIDLSFVAANWNEGRPWVRILYLPEVVSIVSSGAPGLSNESETFSTANGMLNSTVAGEATRLNQWIKWELVIQRVDNRLIMNAYINGQNIMAAGPITLSNNAAEDAVRPINRISFGDWVDGGQYNIFYLNNVSLYRITGDITPAVSGIFVGVQDIMTNSIDVDADPIEFIGELLCFANTFGLIIPF